MNPQTINAMEIVMLTIFVVLRIAGTCFTSCARPTGRSIRRKVPVHHRA